MNPVRLFALIALAVVAVAAGPAAAPATTCRHTDIVFYTTDTTRLATELGASASSCADYYLSITPTNAGGPRGGLPVTTIHALGPHFHAMTEVKLNLWATYAATNGWYAAGVEVRREMTVAGYDTSLGDTWAVNEVGEPSNTAMGVAVVKNTGTARQDLRDFVRGLYTGVDGTADPGLVFAADPLQVTSDPSQYKGDLQSWYSDSAFWTDMSQYVRFWGQETYADARAWGVAGSTLAQRTAYLDDYFEHGKRLAAAGDGSTDAARAFFAAAYTPIGNAAFRQPIPNTTTGIGFGYTDIGVTGMQNFVSTQAYALRADDRFGFAVVPAQRNGHGNARGRGSRCRGDPRLRDRSDRSLRREQPMVRHHGRRRTVQRRVEDVRQHARGLERAGADRTGGDGHVLGSRSPRRDAGDDLDRRTSGAAGIPASPDRGLVRRRDDRDVRGHGRRVHRVRPGRIRGLRAAPVRARRGGLERRHDDGRAVNRLRPHLVPRHLRRLRRRSDASDDHAARDRAARSERLVHGRRDRDVGRRRRAVADLGDNRLRLRRRSTPTPQRRHSRARRRATAAPARCR